MLGEQDILRFDVSVHNAFGVAVRKRMQNLIDEQASFFLLDPFVLLPVLVQVSPQTQLGYYVEVSAVDKVFVDLQYVRMVNVLQYFNFLFDLLLVLVFLYFHDFHCSLLSRRFVQCLIDDSECTFPQNPLYGVIFGNILIALSDEVGLT